MAYSTLQDLEDAVGGADRLLQLTDRDRDNATDAGVIARAQASADGWIDSFLRKFNAADLAALRNAPTETIKRIAVDETIFILRSQMPAGVSDSDRDLHKSRMDELKSLRSDDLRVGDIKSPRSRFIENCGPVTRKSTKGMW
jgi:phage gp36-like protein